MPGPISASEAAKNAEMTRFLMDPFYERSENVARQEEIRRSWEEDVSREEPVGTEEPLPVTEVKQVEKPTSVTNPENIKIRRENGRYSKPTAGEVEFIRNNGVVGKIPIDKQGRIILEQSPLKKIFEYIKSRPDGSIYTISFGKAYDLMDVAKLNSFGLVLAKLPNRSVKFMKVTPEEVAKWQNRATNELNKNIEAVNTSGPLEKNTAYSNKQVADAINGIRKEMSDLLSENIICMDSLKLYNKEAMALHEAKLEQYANTAIKGNLTWRQKLGKFLLSFGSKALNILLLAYMFIPDFNEWYLGLWGRGPNASHDDETTKKLKELANMNKLNFLQAIKALPNYLQILDAMFDLGLIDRDKFLLLYDSGLISKNYIRQLIDRRKISRDYIDPLVKEGKLSWQELGVNPAQLSSPQNVLASNIFREAQAAINNPENLKDIENQWGLNADSLAGTNANIDFEKAAATLKGTEPLATSKSATGSELTNPSSTIEQEGILNQIKSFFNKYKIQILFVGGVGAGYAVYRFNKKHKGVK